MTLVPRIRESFIKDNIINWLTIGKAQIDDLFIWDIEWDILEGDSGDIQSLLRNRYVVLFESHWGPSNYFMHGYPWSHFHLLGIIPSGIVVESETVFDWHLKNIEKEFTKVLIGQV